MFILTANAIHAIRSFDKGINDASILRYRVTSECCNQLQYDLSITTEVHKKEEHITFDGVTVVYHPSDLRYLKGTEIDFVDDGFAIHSPHPLVSF
ncbi:HesB/IscA family protein [Cytobacillus purgationiresistens]|nr:iron-sulfur cluster biosynthesis family protein [Cytobacillus purgationiresistens]